ncbi:hydrogen gas-evolving membrane-bound hydrogenase subunit E [Candidatus Xianfuyuplasma coldseepsis]|uniref:Cation:proton antiporter n=1 Tax=Candidatus Xianfuyuplasma coldseepsis TaxID=2782163 RepID=A0A7L7KVE6_9MOLU|nr:hydrogen gas-evolving membrane-bound hydrogenase subunit E [Xianfuyuplasma coldseepsis]QMS85954.1 cation:proton antiporter [Xianfuyuplasma coldseepsis]
MKQFLSFIVVAALGVLIVLSLQGNALFVEYGDIRVADRISQQFIDRDVNGANSGVEFGESVDLESGPANIVTSIVADYRSFDTLGEITVLFISSLGVALLLATSKAKRMELDFHPNFMLKVGSRALFGIILMTGVFIIVHGHLTPGGGFPGGTMIASSILLLYLADDEFRTKVKSFKVLESIAGSLYVIIGLVGLFVFDYFLINFLDNGILGELVSSGIIPIVYVLIGLKVGSEISGIIDHFLTEEAM